MPLYYFDIDDGFHQNFDDVGREFPNMQAARVAAIDTSLEYVRSCKHDNNHCEFVAEVADESGKAILRTSLSVDTELLNPRLAKQRNGSPAQLAKRPSFSAFWTLCKPWCCPSNQTELHESGAKPYVSGMSAATPIL